MNAVTCQASACRYTWRPRAPAGGRDRRQAARGPGVEPQLRQPAQRRGQRRERPQAQRQRHRAAGQLVDRDRDQRAGDRPGGQAEQVDPDQQPGLLRPAPFGQAGQQHVHQRDRGARDGRAGEQQAAGQRAAQQQPGGQQHQRGAEHPFLAEPAAERRGHPGAHAEGQHRQRGQRGQRRVGQVQAGGQFREQRRQAGDGGPQVEGQRDHAEHEHRGALGTAAASGCGRGDWGGRVGHFLTRYRPARRPARPP